eukprot:CAMPEP_0197658724 /NCGR_PEP_ID=MMETSP1338-20131121/45400_1 /TAXON_ID=43686 ORGANISM="Pelagodinium beii, Strain RCC1491" /NCGR_SAMPLE_ID=MMETSP1338 /ASSEMBLY_ACC=CAM_ASM_000754 /LENGTH=527 /DNA_ID=CAMNT_0043235359 /DNA_START=61 /DNA_END=1644 /DNA_ORIENTATION=+
MVAQTSGYSTEGHKQRRLDQPSFKQVESELQALIKQGAGVSSSLLLKNATVPRSVVQGDGLPDADDEGNVVVDVLISEGHVVSVGKPSSNQVSQSLDLARKMLWPCFCEPHMHLFKSQGVPRAPNRTGSINDAYASEACDRPWSYDDLSRRMDFTIRSAHIHGVRVIRTHLDGTEDDRLEQRTACWQALDDATSKWKGSVEIQGVANLYLPLWSKPQLAERQLAEVLKRSNVVLGAYCGIIRVKDTEEFTAYFRELFRLAKLHNLAVDVHIDENNSPEAVGMLIAAGELSEARKAGYKGHVTFGHCCALSLVPRERQEQTLELFSQLADITVVANPLTNAWLQDRRGCSDFSGCAIPEDPPRTPQWRGLTLLQEMQARGIAVAIAGDNVRDWWFNYGDADPMEYFRVAILNGHLDKPHGALSKWSASINSLPLKSFGAEFCQRTLGQSDLCIGPGLTADFLIFNARRFSELLSRPQSDRIVVRSKRGSECKVESLSILDSELPDYAELDDLVDQITPVDSQRQLHQK